MITNIHELKKKVQAQSLKTLHSFNKIDLKTARQIASHDYIKIDFKPIFEICMNLISDSAINELKGFMNKNDEND